MYKIINKHINQIIFIKIQHKDFNKNNQHLHIIEEMILLDMMEQKIKMILYQIYFLIYEIYILRNIL